VRGPTWLPCRSQIDYKLVDNAFVEIADWRRAQQLANGLKIKRLHSKLDQFAQTDCPIHRDFGMHYHWSTDQCEYATDVLFKRQADLAAIYGTLTRTAMHAVRPDNIATVLARN
jgi:hypothetical protein